MRDAAAALKTQFCRPDIEKSVDLERIATQNLAAAPAGHYRLATGHLCAALAGADGKRGEYVNKAIDFYKEAMKLDSSSPYVAEELTELYIQAGQLQKAVLEAEDLLKQNPDNLNA